MPPLTDTDGIADGDEDLNGNDVTIIDTRKIYFVVPPDRTDPVVL